MFAVDVNGNHVNESNFNNVIQPLLTDFYQITMAYAYWKSGKQNDFAVFDLFFRKNPFKGEFTVFAGLNEVLLFLKNFRFSKRDIDYIRNILPSYTEEEFFTYLLNLTAKDVKIYAIKEGTICFPREPLIRIEGPLAIGQLLETTLLTLINYASLIATNAARYRKAAGDKIKLLEMGLRRAQGPDGALSASRYSFLAGFDGTSNLLAGKLYGMPVVGTHAHSFIMSYSSLDEITLKSLKDLNSGNDVDFVEICSKYRTELSKLMNILLGQSNDGEFASFIAYAISFPTKFCALLDTYDVLKSGILNFCSVSLALFKLGYSPVGCRIDSGDLSYLSNEIYKYFCRIKNEYGIEDFDKLDIIASGDIDEDTIYSLNEQQHKLTAFGIGTKLVTCSKQSALGAVYKLVEVNNKPCIKLSYDVDKVTIPCRKLLYRLYSENNTALIDLMTQYNENDLKINQRILCRHPFYESKRAYVTPKIIKPLLELCNPISKIQDPTISLKESRGHFFKSLNEIRPDTIRHVNPTPYKVSLSANLYAYMHDLWLENAPIGELE